MGDNFTFMMTFFDINTVFFTLWDYPMSYLEFFGTILNILCVWLTTRKSVWNWPVGILAVVLFGALFYQIQLYSDFVEQIYFLVTGIWGWVMWSRWHKDTEERGRQICHSSWRERMLTGLIIVLGTVLLGLLMSRIHLLLPQWFQEEASFPYLDAFTTVASFAAQILLVYRRVDNWYLWILIDIIGIGLYYEKEVKLVAVLYGIFLFLAIKGALAWRKELSIQRKGTALEAAREEVAIL